MILYIDEGHSCSVVEPSVSRTNAVYRVCSESAKKGLVPIKHFGYEIFLARGKKWLMAPQIRPNTILATMKIPLSRSSPFLCFGPDYVPMPNKVVWELKG